MRHGVEREAGRFALLRSRGFVHGGGGSEDRAEGGLLHQAVGDRQTPLRGLLRSDVLRQERVLWGGRGVTVVARGKGLESWAHVLPLYWSVTLANPFSSLSL